MTTLLEVVAVATQALRSRLGRTLLMATGPLLAVTVVVGAFGVLQSTTGQLRTALANLGADLVVVESASGGLVPQAAPGRIARVPTVEAVTATLSVPQQVHHRSPDQPGVQPLEARTLAVQPNLRDLFGIDLAWGRDLAGFDDDAATTAAVVGAEVADQLALSPGELTTIHIGAYPFGVVGVLEPAQVGESLDQAVLISPAAARRLFDIDPGWTQIQARVAPADVARTAPLLDDVATHGGPGDAIVRIATDLLAAQSAADATLAGAVIALGGLVLLVGGFGIANVMLLSVLERRREIGTRRALGHPRAIIAGQFIIETILIGIGGALAGAVVGIVVTVVVARLRGWVVVLDLRVLAVAVASAIVATTIAGLYPAWRAARLEPLAAIRAE